MIKEVGISHGQGFLLANPAPELQSETIGSDNLVDSHRARRLSLLGSWGSTAGG